MSLRSALSRGTILPFGPGSPVRNREYYQRDRRWHEDIVTAVRLRYWWREDRAVFNFKRSNCTRSDHEDESCGSTSAEHVPGLPLRFIHYNGDPGASPATSGIEATVVRWRSWE